MSVGTEGTRTTGSAATARPRRLPRLPRDGRLRRSVAVGSAVLVLVLAAGVAFLATRPTGWTAEATAMVVPDQGLDPAAGAGYYETLSRGHVVATVAEILRRERFRDEAAAELGVDGRDAGTVVVQVVPNTAVVRVAVTAPDAAVAERMADGVVGRATAYDGLPEPYTLVPVAAADGGAYRRDVSVAGFAAMLLLIGLVAAVAAQQAAYHLSVAAGREPRS